MRVLLSMLVSVMLAACILAPDDISLGSRIDKYGKYDSTTITARYRNPWKSSRVEVVREEYVSLSGGNPNADAP